MKIRGDEKPDIDALLTEIRAKVESRRQSGFYPEDLEEHLSQHFRRVVNFRARDLSNARKKLDEVRSRASFEAARISTDSQVPGGGIFHRLVARIVSRQVQGALDQVQSYAHSVWEGLEEIILILEEPTSEQAHMMGLADSILERLSDLERLQKALRSEVDHLDQARRH